MSVRDESTTEPWRTEFFFLEGVGWLSILWWVSTSWWKWVIDRNIYIYPEKFIWSNIPNKRVLACTLNKKNATRISLSFFFKHQSLIWMRSAQFQSFFADGQIPLWVRICSASSWRFQLIQKAHLYAFFTRGFPGWSRKMTRWRTQLFLCFSYSLRWQFKSCLCLPPHLFSYHSSCDFQTLWAAGLLQVGAAADIEHRSVEQIPPQENSQLPC